MTNTGRRSAKTDTGWFIGIVVGLALLTIGSLVVIAHQVSPPRPAVTAESSK